MFRVGVGQNATRWPPLKGASQTPYIAFASTIHRFAAAC
jgi:hypothetical protein